MHKNNGISITVKSHVCMVVSVWRGMHMKEWVCVYIWASATPGMFECETEGVSYSSKGAYVPVHI